jgi:hypothetical protein
MDLWESLRENCFANHVFANLDAVERALTGGLVALESGSNPFDDWVQVDIFHIFARE